MRNGRSQIPIRIESTSRRTRAKSNQCQERPRIQGPTLWLADAPLRRVVKRASQREFRLLDPVVATTPASDTPHSCSLPLAGQLFELVSLLASGGLSPFTLAKLHRRRCAAHSAPNPRDSQDSTTCNDERDGTKRRFLTCRSLALFALIASLVWSHLDNYHPGRPVSDGREMAQETQPPHCLVWPISRAPATHKRLEMSCQPTLQLVGG